RRGGLPARKVSELSTRVHYAAAFLMPMLAVLESVDWEFDRFRSRERLGHVLRASRQAMAAVAHHLSGRPPIELRLAARPFVVRAILAIGGRIVPFDLEAYLRAHFTKVGDQTRDFL